MLETIGSALHSFSSWLNIPLFITLIGGGLFFLIYPVCTFPLLCQALKSLRIKDDKADGQISSFQALSSAIAATVGLGNISGVAVALTMGGPGAIFWMWVRPVLAWLPKFL
jgi:AGCS family alanine or glycine:cation symporter